MSSYSPIASQTLSSTASSVTFGGIPQDYTDLIIVGNVFYTASGYNSWIQFNGDTGTNYSYTVLYANPGTGSSPGGTRGTSTSNILFDRQGDYTTAGGSGYTHVMNYSNGSMYKTVLNRYGQPSSSIEAKVGLWRNTAPITSIVIGATTTTFAAGTTFSLYGIQAGTPKAQGGQIVTTDGTYWYHVFLNSGKFTPSTALTCDYLVIAGGGGGHGYAYGGGGGAGGLRSTVGSTGGGGSLESSLSLSATDYSVIVGAGGFGGTGEITGNYYSTATNGNDTIFSSITSTGGGRGGGGRGGYGSNSKNGGNGGSGGGANGDAGATAGTRVTGQGYAGGTGSTDSASYANGGGGGGAGAAGSNANSGAAGDGGIGVQISALATPTNTGVSGYYAGGGGGGGTGSEGSGGTGGGGGASEGGGTSGTANTGSGGGAAGGSSAGSNGGNGGSGLVIVRYAV